MRKKRMLDGEMAERRTDREWRRMTMNDLKPCPFCGGKDSGILTTSYDEYWFAVFCEKGHN